MDENQSAYESVFVARQPIFDRDMGVWGYELLFRQGQENIAKIVDPDLATRKVIADGFSLAQMGVKSGAKALVNFSSNLLLDETAFTLPPEAAVIEILETVTPEPEIIQACKELKRNGYTLALDDFVGDSGFEPLLELADIVKVDIMGMDPKKLENIARQLRSNSRLLAEKVETKEEFELTKELGFEYFQGFFFSRPEIIPGRKLSSNEVSKIKLLQEIGKKDFEFCELAKIVQTDLSLSYRLLQYINSSAFGMRSEVESIQRALTLLGKIKLQQWLRVVLMVDVSSSPKAQELVHMSVHRGRFLQMLAEQVRTPFEKDSMFMLGFFSLLDAILGQNMKDLLDQLPIEPWLKNSLIEKESLEHLWIELADVYERADWERLSQLLDELELDSAQTIESYSQAFEWTLEILETAN